MPRRAAAPGDLAAQVRAHDHDRYISILYAPQGDRPALFALFAFAAELARIPASVSESGLGEIRLEWWRGAIDDLRRGQETGHPVADALGPFVRAGRIDAEGLQAMIDGRTADLYADPVADMTALEARFGATLSLPIRIAIALLAPQADRGGAADTAGHGGVALGLAALIGHLPRVAAERPELLPAALLDAHGARARELAKARRTKAGAAVRQALLDEAGRHLAAAVAAARALPAPALPALLPLAPLAGDLALLARGESGLRGGLYRQWAMWRAARRGRIG